jgi:hypothetical protein
MKNSKEIQDFENSINNSDNTEIKYTIDRSIEASVKYDYLTEIYGKEKVDAVVPDFLVLYEHEVFLEIKQKLETGK